MVELQHISTPSKSSSSSDQTSPSSSSPTSPLPSNYLPHLLFPPPPSSSFSPLPFMDPMSCSPTLYHPASYYHHNNYNYYHYYYFYPFPNQYPSNFYYYPQTITSPFPPSNDSAYYGDSQFCTPMDVPVINTQDAVVLQPQPPAQVPAEEKQFFMRNAWNHGNESRRVRLSKKPGKGKQKGITRKSEHATGCGSQSHLPQSLTPPPSNALHSANCTTVMVKNIPNSLSRRGLIYMLDRHCRELNSKVAANPCPFQYDFLYLPFDFAKKQNLGYAFVNFTTVEGAATLQNCWTGKGWKRSHKILDITPAKLQGLEKCKKHFEDSRFFCHSEEYMPVEFCPPRDGLNIGACKTMTIGKLAYSGNAAPSKAKFYWDKVKQFIPPRLSR